MDDYATFLYVEDFPALTAYVNARTDRWVQEGSLVAAKRLLTAYNRLKAGLVRLEGEVAVAGTEILRQVEEDTRVRPDTGGGGGERLEDHLHCDPLGLKLVGSVGIANEDELDHNVPWWWTNEEGSSSRVGGLVVGFFLDTAGGRSAPDAELFRQHPLFETTRESKAPAMLIKKPIPERRFIEKAIPEIEAVWRDRFDILRAEFTAEMEVAYAEHRAFELAP